MKSSKIQGTPRLGQNPVNSTKHGIKNLVKSLEVIIIAFWCVGNYILFGTIWSVLIKVNNSVALFFVIVCMTNCLFLSYFYLCKISQLKLGRDK